jgi:hypothetical protein
MGGRVSYNNGISVSAETIQQTVGDSTITGVCSQDNLAPFLGIVRNQRHCGATMDQTEDVGEVMIPA